MTVNPVNDVPTITHNDQIRDDNQGATTVDNNNDDVGVEDTPLVFCFAGGGINTNRTGNAGGDQSETALTDNRVVIVDGDATSLTVTLSVNNGTLKLVQTTGLTFISGADGTASMKFSGAPADIQAALGTPTTLGTVAPFIGVAGRGGLTFNPNADFNGVATLNVTVQDEVSTVTTVGTGQVAGQNDSASSNFIELNIRSVNDDPVGVTDTFNANEGSSNNSFSVLVNDKPGPATATDETGQILTIVGLNAIGQTSAVTTGGGTVSFGPIDANGRVLTVFYTPAAGFFGTDSFQYISQDNGQSASLRRSGSGFDPDNTPAFSLATTVNINVVGINDSPRVDIQGTPTFGRRRGHDR